MKTGLHTQWISDIEKHGKNLSEWDDGFVDSCDSILGKGKSLSEDQVKILEKIYDEKVG